MRQQYQLTEIVKPVVKEKQQITVEELDEETRAKVEKLLKWQYYDKEKKEKKQNYFYIDSQSRFTLFWNLLYILVFYYATFQISMALSLPPLVLQNMVSSDQSYLPVYLTILVIWCIDIVLSFFKGYYVLGQVQIVSSIRRTALHYLKEQFVIDIIMVGIYTIPIYYQQNQLNFLQLIPMLFGWVKKKMYSKQNQKILQYKRLFLTIFLMTELFIDALMISNYAGCIFLGMDLYLYNQSYYGQGTSSPYYWLTNNVDYPVSLIDGPWWQAFIWAQSFSTGTLSTLAPGPFVRNPWQAFYSLFIMIIFMVLASYIGDVVIELSSTFFQKRWAHEENMLSFDKFMKIKQVKKDVRIKVSNYFQLVWELEMKIQSEEHATLIERLPTHIKEQLMIEMGFAKQLQFLQFIKHQANVLAELKKNIAMKMQRITIDSNTSIFQSDRCIPNEQKQIFYIKKGMAKFYLKHKHNHLGSENVSKSLTTEKLLSLTNVGKLLGVYEFITGQNYTKCCKTIDFCLIQTLKWSDFWDIITELQISEQFNQMKHELLVEKELTHKYKFCVVCLSEHIQSECPELYYNKKIEKSFDFSNLSSSQCKRLKKVRKYISSKKTLKKPLGQQLLTKILQDIISDIIDTKSLRHNYTKEIQSVANFSKYKKHFNIKSF